MTVIFAICGVLAGVLMVVLVVPFRVQAFVGLHQLSPSAGAQVDWFWGAVSIEITSASWTPSLFGIKIRQFTFDNEKRVKDGRSRNMLRSLSKGYEHRQAFFTMIGRAIRALRLRLCVFGMVGTGDPADTAMLFGLVKLLNNYEGVTLDIKWEWIEEELEFDARCLARVWVGHLLGVAAVSLISRENRLALRAMSS